MPYDIGLEHVERLAVLSGVVERHRVHIRKARVRGIQLRRRRQMLERLLPVSLAHQQQAERMLERGVVWRADDSLAQHALAFSLVPEFAIEIGEIHRRWRKGWIERERRRKFALRVGKPFLR